MCQEYFKNDSRKLQCCFKSIFRVLKVISVDGVSSKFQGGVIRVSSYFLISCKGVSCKLIGCFKIVSEVLQGSFRFSKDVSRLFYVF